MDVNVLSHNLQSVAVWFGGSMLASTDQFQWVAEMGIFRVKIPVFCDFFFVDYDR
jgi:hypothetical protein